MTRHTATWLTAGLSVLALTGCATVSPTAGSPTLAPLEPKPVASSASASPASTAAPSASDSAKPTAAPSASASATQPASKAAAGSCAALTESLSLEEQAGQLIVVGTHVTLDGAARAAIKKHHLGAVILMGNSTAGVQGTRAVTDEIRALNPKLPVLVTVDQEGGLVQRLKGPGFDTIPNATAQGAMSDAELTAAAREWGTQMNQAGVNLTFAPVGDVVPPEKLKTNAPIGRLGRGYGTSGEVVARKVAAFVSGMRSGGVGTSVKHFPNLGEVTDNTDHAQGVTDTVTDGRGDELKPYRAAIQTGTDTIMVSTATFTKIDPNHMAAFSPAVIGILRNDLGFGGVVVTDDLGVAKSMASVPPGKRAVRHVAAGGDLSISVSPSVASAMAQGLVDAAQADPAFAAKVKASAERVLTLKSEHGLVECQAVRG